MKRLNFGMLKAIAAALMPKWEPPKFAPGWQGRMRKRRKRWERNQGRSKYEPHQGAQECARRKKQWGWC